ncbi:hypothetical protein V6Z11_A07G058300 [Gossypium hirsutum]
MGCTRLRATVNAVTYGGRKPKNLIVYPASKGEREDLGGETRLRRGVLMMVTISALFARRWWRDIQ